MKHKHTYLFLLALTVLLALPAWAATVITVDGDFMMSQSGVRLNGPQGSIEFTEGHLLLGTVALPAVLASHGLTGVKKGDEVQVTFIRDRRFKLMHVPSGLSVEFTYRPKK